MRYVTAWEGSVIDLGYQGENGALTVNFPVVSDWTSKYGSGTFSLRNKRTNDQDGYPVVVTSDSTNVKWVVSSSDNQYKGKGRCQLVYTVGTVIAKSCTYETFVNSGLNSTASAPAAWQGWVESLLEQVTDISNLDKAAQRITYSNATSFPAGTIGKAIHDLENKTITANDVTYSASETYGNGTVGSVIIRMTPVRESHVIQKDAWDDLLYHEPFMFCAQFTVTSSLGSSSEVELICDDAMTFAKCGICIGGISGQTVTVYAVDCPEEDVTLKLEIKEV